MTLISAIRLHEELPLFPDCRERLGMNIFLLRGSENYIKVQLLDMDTGLLFANTIFVTRHLVRTVPETRYLSFMTEM
jgi:hypothetical protein